MKLSILDQSPVYEGCSFEEALDKSIQLAQLGESLGYERYWLTEHHNFKSLASSAPEIILATIGSKTNKIRIGSGAVLLPHYKSYKVAEVFNTLAALFPNRVDIGVGRAPGGSAEATMALSDNYLQEVYKFPQKIRELIYFLQLENQETNPLPVPIPNIKPQIWLLGTSKKSALLAAEYGVSYAFGQFMSDKNGSEIIAEYIQNFKSEHTVKSPKALITVNVFCAETKERADEVMTNMYKRKTVQGKIEENDMTDTIVGDSIEVKDRLEEIRAMHQVEEIMLNVPSINYHDRIKSFKLIAEELL
ncbi:MsnO8 family LLM class oxidoreductase [Litchfieldia alkalitelluris]|uniref:MsnO8 family LLM class oxidoreductase n=1 Tax=Litchfieldia alkalitelluris TaxID=304268 RepID=UPI000998C8CA|nr:MsnO8 family LLM class oxidoreductase [Litchfieldia alkalitelluris]